MLRNIKAMSVASLAQKRWPPVTWRPNMPAELPVPQMAQTRGRLCGRGGQPRGDRAGRYRWPDFFTDPRLVRVIETNLANNRDLRIAVANVEQARAQYKVQRADLLPTVGATGTATYSEQPLVSSARASASTDVYQAQVGISAGNRPVRAVHQPDQGGAGAIFRLGRKPQCGPDRTGGPEMATARVNMAADQELLSIARTLATAFKETLDLNKARFDKGIADRTGSARGTDQL